MPPGTAPRKCPLQFTGPGVAFSPLQPVGVQAFSSFPPPGQKSIAFAGGSGRGPGRAGQAGLASAVAFPATGRAPGRNPGCPYHPRRLLYAQEASGQPGAARRMGRAEERLPALGVCPGSNSGHPLKRDPWPCPALAPIPTPKPPDTNTATPKQLEAHSGCGPPISWLCLPSLGLGRGWQDRERGPCRWHRTLLVTVLSDFYLRGHSPSSLRPQILPPHLPPPSRGSPTSRREDSFIKVFRNAGGWGRRGGGCNLENWFQCVFRLWPLGPAGVGGRGDDGAAWKTRGLPGAEAPQGCLFLGLLPHTRTPPRNTGPGFQPHLLKMSFVSACLGDGILLFLSLSPRSLVFQKERI